MSKKLLIGCGAAAALTICVVIVLVAVVGIASDGDEAPVLSSASATPIPPAPSFEEIRAQHEVMTEAQWKNYRTQIEGCQAVAWRGWVEEVTGNPGRYRVRVDMDSPDEFLSVSDVNFAVPDDVALALQKDQPLTFTGQIETAIDFVGSLDITLEHATILEN